jgi:hypothetical protein
MHLNLKKRLTSGSIPARKDRASFRALSPKKNMCKKRSIKTYWIGLILVAAYTFYQILNLTKDIKATNWPTVAGQIH